MFVYSLLEPTSAWASMSHGPSALSFLAVAVFEALTAPRPSRSLFPRPVCRTFHSQEFSDLAETFAERVALLAAIDPARSSQRRRGSGRLRRAQCPENRYNPCFL